MRKILLSDGPAHMRPYAAIELDILAYFPEDEISRDQAMVLLDMEYQRWLRVGQDRFEFSGLVQRLVESSAKAYGQNLLAGYVGLAMYGLARLERRVSLEAAAMVVSEFANSGPKQRIIKLKNGVFVHRELPLVSDLTTIKKIFRKKRSSAHVPMAELVTAEYLTVRNGFDPQPEADACYIATVKMFEEFLLTVPNSADWNIWRILFSPPNPDALAFYNPSDELMSNLMNPWLELQISGGGSSSTPVFSLMHYRSQGDTN